MLEIDATTAAATVSEAIRSRHSTRGFTQQPVDAAVVRDLLEIARFAPSGGNLQPWIVHVLSGASLAAFRAFMAPQLNAMPMGEQTEYPVYPPELKEPYRSRRRQCGEDLYALVGVARDDRSGKLRQFARNYDFFGAPVGMFFFSTARWDRRNGRISACSCKISCCWRANEVWRPVRRRPGRCGTSRFASS